MHLEPNPQSAGFVWQDKSLTSDLLNQAQLDQWNQEGYLLLKGVLPVDLVAEVEQAIDPLEAEREAVLIERGGTLGISKAHVLTFTAHLVKRSAELRAFTCHSVLTNLCHNLLGENARLYWDQAVYKKPGNSEVFPWHQDNGYTFVEPEDYLTCWIPLTSATTENGCPWVIPKVHRQGTFRHKVTPLGYQCAETAKESIAVPAEAGDIVVFSSLTPHRTGPNLTRGIRKAYIVQYAHDGADVVSPHGTRTPQQDPERQYPVLQGGKPVRSPE